jgi:predicted transcriptional regulator YheO
MREDQDYSGIMHPIIERYVPIADLIVQTFGQDCEVVLHDLRTPQRSVVYVVNNQVTGREIGQNFEHLVSQIILSDKLENDTVANYYFTTSDGKLIKPSTALLRDLDGNIVGAICINIDTSKIT